MCLPFVQSVVIETSTYSRVLTVMYTRNIRQGYFHLFSSVISEQAVHVTMLADASFHFEHPHIFGITQEV